MLIHGGTSYNSQQVANIGAGNKYGDPLFMAPAFGTTGNYHLQQGSPAIDAGTTTAAPAQDLDGRNRPLNTFYDMGCYESDAPVPVELASFNATLKNGQVELQWETASESNNFGFEIQKSQNAVDFLTIGFIAGNGTSARRQKYSFIDKEFQAGDFYYRLKQLDYDGTFTYSNIAHISFAPTNNIVLGQNYPNPFNSATIIPFEISKKSFVRMALYDMRGRLVKTLTSKFFEAGTHEIKINIAELASGIYFYELIADQNSKKKKMIVLF